MLHLDPERLAALADHEPTADEAAHLAICAHCASERQACAELLSLAAAERHVPLGEPLTQWSALSARLRGERLVRGAEGARASARTRPWLRVAAAVVLALGGAAVGRATAGHPLAPAGGKMAAAHTGGASLVSNGTDSTHAILSVQDALILMRRAEVDYRVAAAYIAAHDTASLGADRVDHWRTRVAAIDRVYDAALAAVNEAPADPFVNQYLISARTARAVTLQQLNSSLPHGTSLASY